MVAIKFLFDPNEDPKNEIEAMQKLNHPNIVKCFGFKKDGHQHKDDGRIIPVTYIVMELV